MIVHMLLLPNSKLTCCNCFPYTSRRPCGWATRRFLYIIYTNTVDDFGDQKLHLSYFLATSFGGHG